MKVIVTTSNKSVWTMRTFAYLWNKYYDAEPVAVLCESLQSVKDLNLPSNFKPYQAGETWALQEWSNGLIRYLNSIDDQQVLIMLDDYWLVRSVDGRGIFEHLIPYLSAHQNVLRIDLTSDRLYASGPRYPHEDPDHDVAGYYDLVNRAQTQYQMSLMPGLWNKGALLSILREGWNPWDVEIEGTNVVNASDFIVLGTRQNPIKIVNSLRNQSALVDIQGLKSDVVADLRQLEYLPADKEYITS